MTWVSRRDWMLIAAAAVAGALSVPVHPLITPAAALVAAIVALIGLKVWRWSGLRALARSDPPRGLARIVRPIAFLMLGLVVGLVLLAAIRFVIEPAVPSAGERIARAGDLPVWRRLVIIYVAAVGEEIIFRLLLLSLIAGLIARISRNATPDRRAVWIANVVSALLFAAVHLPAWSAAGALSPSTAIMVLALNGLGAVVFGHLFVKRGIGAAIWAHAGGDCAIQLIGPLT